MTSDIELGDIEEAFYLREKDYSVDHIIRSLSHLTCPYIRCSRSFRSSHNKDDRSVSIKYTFSKIFQHIKDEHYNPEKFHNSFDNLLYEILQQLVIWENAIGKHSQIHQQRRQLVMHILNSPKHVGLPLIDINALLPKKSVGAVGELSYFGIKNCPMCKETLHG